MTRPAWIVIGAFGLAIALWVGVNMSSGNRGQEASPGVSLEEAFTRARAERKCVLVDVYTDWCSWCKKMDRETYTNTQVRAMLEKEFLVVKLNAESDAELTFNGSRMTMVEFAQQAGGGQQVAGALENRDIPAAGAIQADDPGARERADGAVAVVARAAIAGGRRRIGGAGADSDAEVTQ